MPLTTPSRKLFIEIQRLLSPNGETLKSLNSQVFVEKLKFLLMDSIPSLDKIKSSNNTLVMKPEYFNNKILKFKICILYLESISKDASKNKTPSTMHDAATKAIIENFEEFSRNFKTANNVWEQLLQSFPKLLTSYANNPLSLSSDPIKKQIRSVFLKIMSHELLSIMAMAYKEHRQLSFVVSLTKGKTVQKIFLNSLILSIYKANPLPFPNKTLSDLINYFIKEFDTSFTPEDSLKRGVLTYIMSKSPSPESGKNNPFVDFIKQNHRLAIIIIKADKQNLTITTPLVFNILKQTQIPIPTLCSLKRINNAVNRILTEAIINGDNLSQLSLYPKENKKFISNLMAFIFKTTNTSPEILTNTLTLAETHLFQDMVITINFIKQIPLLSRYHFSIAFIYHLIKEKKTIPPKLLEFISDDLSPINKQSLSERPATYQRFVFIMNFIAPSSPTIHNSLSKDKLPLLFWMVKYFHNVIPSDFFINSHDFVSDLLLKQMIFNPTLHSKQSLTEQINAFKKEYLLKASSLTESGDRGMSLTQDTGEPPKKRAHATASSFPPFKDTESLFKKMLNGNCPQLTYLHELSSSEPSFHVFPSKVKIPPSFQLTEITPPCEALFSPYKALFKESYTAQKANIFPPYKIAISTSR